MALLTVTLVVVSACARGYSEAPGESTDPVSEQFDATLTSGPRLRLTQESFSTPSGSIGCVAREPDTGIYCTVSPDKFPELGCDVNRLVLVELDESGVAVMHDGCVSRAYMGRYVWPVPVPVDTAVEVGKISCWVHEHEVSCGNSERHGFTLTLTNFQAF